MNIMGIIIAEQVRFNTLVLFRAREVYKDNNNCEFTLKSLFNYLYNHYKSKVYNKWDKFSKEISGDTGYTDAIR